MALDPDELAGVCDLFGGLSRDELARAAEELAFRRGDEFDADAHDAAVADAIAAFVLLELAPASDDTAADAGEPLLVPGPRAFPRTPDGGADLPHILDVSRRDVPGDAVESAVRARLAAAVNDLDEDDAERASVLLDVTYDAAALTGGEFGDVRDAIERYV
ncbi:MAG: hypothetical protein ABEJ80_00050 [Halarchaeum sp.]